MKTKPSLIQRATQQALDPLRAAGSRAPALLSTGKRGWYAATRLEVERVHFDPTFLSPFDLGRKTLNVALFELATAGLRPHSAQMAPGVNQGTSEPFIEEVYRGVTSVADRFGVELGFGNPVHSPTCFSLQLLMLGERMPALPAPKPGDRLAVTGSLGAATAGLHCLRRFGWPAVKDYAEVVRAHLCPEPPLTLALKLSGAKTIGALTASVDGTAADLHRMCGGHDIGAWIDESLIPVSAKTREAASYLGMNPRQWALFGAEDFGLFLVVKPGKSRAVEAAAAKAGAPLTWIGEVRKASHGLKMLNLEKELVGLPNRSWNPLVRKKTR
jgi:thiamine-monophosphate kinase